MLADDLAPAAEQDPGVRLIRHQRRVIARPWRPSDPGLVTVIQSEAKEIAEGGQRPLGRIGLRFLQRTLMCLAQGRAAALAHAAAVALDDRAAGANTDS